MMRMINNIIVKSPPVFVLYVFYLFTLKIDTFDKASNLIRKDPKHEELFDIFYFIIINKKDHQVIYNKIYNQFILIYSIS